MRGMPSCRQVARALSTGELEGSPLSRRLAVRLHLLLCQHCRRYARQIRAIGTAARQVMGGQEGERESLERLRRALLDRATPPKGDGAGGPPTALL